MKEEEEEEEKDTHRRAKQKNDEELTLTLHEMRYLSPPKWPFLSFFCVCVCVCWPLF